MSAKIMNKEIPAIYGAETLRFRQAHAVQLLHGSTPWFSQLVKSMHDDHRASRRIFFLKNDRALAKCCLTEFSKVFEDFKELV